jgi:hypothetical protein
MMHPVRPLVLALSLLALAGCDRSNPPSEQVEQAVEKAVAVVEGGEAPSGPFAPRDECGALEGAQTFLNSLRSAVRLRDADALLALAADDIKLGFGGEDGAANLRLALVEGDAALWDDLAEVVELGCAANAQGGLTMPWYFDQPIEGDPFETMIVTGVDIPVRQAAQTGSPSLATVSWDVVQLAPQEDAGGTVSFGGDIDGWRLVRLPAEDGVAPVEGYVRAEDLRSVVDYRLLAASHNGRWQIVALLAGD